MKYRTKEGDVIDAICTAYYGMDGFDLDLVFAANPGLADLGPVYGSGLIIELPDRQEASNPEPTIRLWD